MTLRLSKAEARGLVRLGAVLATVTLRGGAATVRTQSTLESVAHPTPPTFWSDGELQCSAVESAQAFLTASNFTASFPETINVRPWIAWYTAAEGWHWLGVQGQDASPWYEWTATPTDVARSLPASRFSNVVYGAGSTAAMQQVCSHSKAVGAGYVYVTDATPPNPYGTLPSNAYWTNEVSAC